jgi:hypothetical protein
MNLTYTQYISHDRLGIGIDYCGIGIGIDYFGIGIGIEVCYKKIKSTN